MISLIAFETPETGTAYCSADAVRSIYTDDEGSLRLDIGSPGGDFIIVPRSFRVAHVARSIVGTIVHEELEDFVKSLNKILPTQAEMID